MSNRVAVLGTGALGALFAARLARAGAAVTMVGSWQAARAAIAREGVQIEEPDGQRWSIDGIRVTGHGSARGRYDLVLVLTKSQQTAAVAPLAARLCATDGSIVTLQNGLGNRETLAAAAGQRAVLSGAVWVGASCPAPGQVKVAVNGPCVIGHATDTPGSRRQVASVVDCLAAAGFAAQSSDDIAAVQWTKLAINCAVNPLSALVGAVNGALVETVEQQRLVASVADEVGAVARAGGIAVGNDLGRRAVAAAQMSAQNPSSMLQDVRNGRPPEIDALTGAVVECARRWDVSAPRNTRLLNAIRALPPRGAPRPASAEAMTRIMQAAVEAE